ncbi:MAG TPA: carbohydrate porin [Steroidobacteraceae bacterium]|jgi:porin|nr:carbohydrate porin [Steroidobacteraceae bacterium]
MRIHRYVIAALGAAILLPVTAHSTIVANDASDAEAQANAGPLDTVQQEPLLGSWAPRKRLADKGVSFSARWVVEPAVNDRGYKDSGWDTVSHIDFKAAFDLGKLGVVDNGKVQIVVTDRFGDGTNKQNTGALIQNQAFYGQGRNFRLNELSYEQTFLDNRLSTKFGFYPMGNDFGKLPYTCNFNNNGNCGHPLGPVYGSGWRDDPTGQWGLRFKWADPSGWYAQAGVYDVNTIRNKPGHGFDLSFKHTRGAFLPVEVGYNHGKTPSDYAGSVRLGTYYDTSRVAELGKTGDTVEGRSGLLVQAEQQVWKPHSDTVRGIAVFGVYTLTDRKTSLLTNYYELGASWRGLVGSRPNDILSLSGTQADINSRVRDAERLAGKEVQTHEQMWELNYGVQLRPWLMVRPAFQYVVQPSGYHSRPDTAVFVAHFQAAF